MSKPNLEQTIITKIDGAVANVKEKYFKEFCDAIDAEGRDTVGAKMNVINKVKFDLIKTIRGNTE